MSSPSEFNPNAGEPSLVVAIFGAAVLIFVGLGISGVVALSTSQSLAPPKADRPRRLAQELSSTVALYHLRTGRNPKTLSSLAATDEGIRPLLASVPRDPWGQQFAMVPNAVDVKRPSSIVSPGPDGRLFTNDDVGTFPDFEDRSPPYCHVRQTPGCWVITADLDRRAKASMADPLSTSNAR